MAWWDQEEPPQPLRTLTLRVLEGGPVLWDVGGVQPRRLARLGDGEKGFCSPAVPVRVRVVATGDYQQRDHEEQEKPALQSHRATSSVRAEAIKTVLNRLTNAVQLMK